LKTTVSFIGWYISPRAGPKSICPAALILQSAIAITNKGLSDREAATLLGIQRTQVCHLMNGHFSRFRESELRGFLIRLAATE
jgi:predicted XRE-type DNA-binding protein